MLYHGKYNLTRKEDLNWRVLLLRFMPPIPEPIQIPGTGSQKYIIPLGVKISTRNTETTKAVHNQFFTHWLKNDKLSPPFLILSKFVASKI